MKNIPHLHHSCFDITTGKLNTAIEMFKLLKCKVVYRPNNGQRWAMVGQESTNFLIQIAEVSDQSISDINTKCQSHISFISDDPQDTIDEIEKWAKENNITFRQGSWSDKERYFDLPELFVNFVIEVMHTSVTEE